MRHTKHYSNYLKLKEQAETITILQHKALIIAKAKRELRAHQSINRAITDAYYAELDAKHAQIDVAMNAHETIIEDKETIMELENVDGKLNLLEVIEDKPKRGRKAKEQN